jgi:hypothetical protein
MGKAKPFLFGGLLGTSFMFVAMQYHVIRSHDGFQLVPRTPQHSVGLAYADIRNWDAAQWTDRPELARALMAHGSGALISKSVAENLADTVTAETATLDQLRSFLNTPPADNNPADEGLFQLKTPDNSDQSGADYRKADDQEPFAIPFPQETRQPEAAEVPRLTRRAVDDAPSQSTPSGKSRFSADDFLNADSPSDPPAAADSGVNRKPTGNNQVRAVQPQPGSISSGTTAAPGGTVESPFESVADDLESRARMALSRAQSTLNDSSTGNGAAARNSETGKFLRDQVPASRGTGTDSASRAATRETLNNAANSDSGSSSRADRPKDLTDSFDPFIE